MLESLVEFSNYSYAYSAWPPLIVGTCIAVLAFVVLWRERFSRVSLSFVGLSLCASIWLLSVGGMYAATRPHIAFDWARIESSAVCFLPTALFIFTLMITRLSIPYRLWIGMTLAISSAFSAIVFFSHEFVSGLIEYPWGAYPHYARAAGVFLGFFALTCGASLFLLWKSYRKIPSESGRHQLKTFFVAFAIAFLGCIDFLGSFGYSVYPVGYLPVYGALLLLAQIIWRYRFADITPAFAASQIMSTMPSALIVLDSNGTICLVNEAACHLLQRKETALIGQPIHSITRTTIPEADLKRLLDEGSLRDYEIIVTDLGPQERCLGLAASVIRDALNQPMAYICVVRDITQRKRAEEALRASESRFRRLMESNIIGFLLVDLQGHILEANDTFLKLLGYDREDFEHGRMAGDTLTPTEYRHVDQWMQNKLLLNGVCPAVEKEYIRKDGSRAPVLVGVVLLEGRQDQGLYFVIDASERRAAQQALQKAYDELELRVEERTTELIQEISRREKAEEALRTQAVTDSLTGLLNRRGFVNLGEESLKEARAKQKTCILLMGDLDGLKPINDTYGHLEGDRALIETARILKESFRGTDIIARVGGDEFAVITLEENAHAIDERLTRWQEKMTTFNKTSGHPYHLGLSLGSAQAGPTETWSLEELMRRADAALYAQKEMRESNATPTKNTLPRKAA